MLIRKLIPLLFLAMLAASCSRSLHPKATKAPAIIYPAPPDTARIQFLTRISSSADIAGSQKSFSRFILGKQEDIAINKPYGMAMHNGRLLVCDTYIRGLHIIDFKNNSFSDFIPTGAGELKVPVNCFIDSKGIIFIADADRKQIVVFDKDFNYLKSFGEAENFKPVDLFVTDNQIFVSNVAGHQIYVYANDSANELQSAFPEVVSGNPESLFSPTNIFVADSSVYVTDFGDFRIKEYTFDGVFKRAVGSYGQGLGQFARPKGIAVDHESNLYVVDAGFENVQIFGKDGNLLMFFGGNYKGPGDMWLPAKVIIDYDNLSYFKKYVDPAYNLKYLVMVTNQFGPDKLNIYGAIEPVKKAEPQK